MQQRNDDSKKHTPHSRVNYEDPSLKFLDWAEHLGLEKTFFGRWIAFLEERFSARRVLLIFIFCLVLSYLIFFQMVVPNNIRVSEMAVADVVSPFSFEMTDEVTTEEKRLRSENTIPIVYDYDTGVFERTSSHVYRAFRSMRNLARDFQWPVRGAKREKQIKEFFNHKSQFEKDIDAPVDDYLFEWLIDNRFHPRIENALVRNLDLWYENKIAESPDRFVPQGQNEVSARVVHKSNSGREYLLNKKDIVDMQVPENFVLLERTSLEKLNETDRSNLLYLARSLVVPNLTLNKQETASRRQKARESVIPVSITIKRNQNIVSKGTIVQPFQMAILKHIESLQSDRRKDVIVISLAFLLSMVILVQFSYLKRFSSSVFKLEFKDLFVMKLIILGVIFLTKFYMFLADAAFISRYGNSLTHSVFLYAAPVAAGPMMVGLLIPSGEIVWLFTSFLALALGIMEDFSYSFAIVSLVGGIAAARGVYNCKKRNDIYRAGLRTGVITALMIAFLFAVRSMEQETSSKEMWLAIPAGFLGGIFSSMFTMIAIPFLETVFNYTTDVKLLELSNLNHPLLKDMLVKSPGTYHHSMMVGSMVEAAAEEIGANALLGKVMSYYHDIGKMEHSNYFIENQKPGANPHDHISPFMSRTLLVAHVKDGVEMGMQHKLGKPIIDGIVQHHGTTLISFFYNKALDQKTETDADFSEDEFRYPGPKPQFREAALCMLADSIEAAARSLDEPTPARLQNIVKNIIQRKFVDGQLDECQLTLKDISKVEDAFIRILLGIYHQRVDYPRSAGGGLGDIALGHTSNAKALK
ncbi:MAG: HDIG domain-containing metalloprotein [Bdellovibrionota bacterium]